jgi:hypothetical protein
MSDNWSTLFELSSLSETLSGFSSAADFADGATVTLVAVVVVVVIVVVVSADRLSASKSFSLLLEDSNQ